LSFRLGSRRFLWRAASSLAPFIRLLLTLRSSRLALALGSCAWLLRTYFLICIS
jgi:hypothetical protein